MCKLPCKCNIESGMISMSDENQDKKLYINMIYNGGDDLHKMKFDLEFIRTKKLVMRFDG
jgi:hypothetical protein